jgi:hypothetical protein
MGPIPRFLQKSRPFKVGWPNGIEEVRGKMIEPREPKNQPNRRGRRRIQLLNTRGDVIVIVDMSDELRV